MTTIINKFQVRKDVIEYFNIAKACPSNMTDDGEIDWTMVQTDMGITLEWIYNLHYIDECFYALLKREFPNA